MADEIHQALLATSQQSRPITQPIGWLRHTPALSPATLLLMLLAAAAIVVGAAFLLTREPRGSVDVLTFRGDPGRTGSMAGPALRNAPIVSWEARMPRQLLNFTMPLVVDGTIFVVDARGNAVAFDIETGRERWSTSFPTDVSGTPLLTGDLLIAPADDGIVRALSLDTGENVWEADVGFAVKSSIGGSGDLAIVGTEDGTLHALDVATGQQRWSAALGAPVVKAVAIEDAMAYVVAGEDMVAVEMPTGEIAWRLDGLTSGALATPVARDGVLYLAHQPSALDAPGEIIALDVTGRQSRPPSELWRWRAPTADELSVGAAVAEAVYAISGDGSVYDIDPTSGIGEPLLRTGGPIGSPIGVTADTLFGASQDGRVYAIDRASGEVLWSKEVDGWPMGPVAADRRLIVSTDQGQLLLLAEAPHASPR